MKMSIVQSEVAWVFNGAAEMTGAGAPWDMRPHQAFIEAALQIVLQALGSLPARRKASLESAMRELAAARDAACLRGERLHAVRELANSRVNWSLQSLRSLPYWDAVKGMSLEEFLQTAREVVE